MSYLILIRHGESRWNKDNKFTGWVDVPLTESGIREAQTAGKNLESFDIDVAYTSKLVRAQETLLLILAHRKKTSIFLHNSGRQRRWSKHNHKEFEAHEIPVYSSEKINERYYGALQGKNKDRIREKYGQEQVFLWRRSYRTRPPKGECLKDVYKRSVPYLKNTIMKHIKNGENVLVSAHGNSMRAIMKYLDDIPEDKIAHLELPMGKPIIYRYENGVLTKQNHKHTFDRPLQWNEKEQQNKPEKTTKAKKAQKKQRHGQKKTSAKQNRKSRNTRSKTATTKKTK